MLILSEKIPFHNRVKENNYMCMKLLAKIRAKFGWTKYKLAKDLGISQTRLNRLEAGANDRYVKLLLKIIELCEKNGMTKDEVIEELKKM